LAQLVGDYLRPAVLRNFLELVTAAESASAERQRDLLRAMARFCLYVGQEQLSSLNAAFDLREIQEDGHYISRLRALANDLVGSGELLGDLVRVPSGEGKVAERLSMRDVIQSAWDEVSRSLDADEQRIFYLEGECSVLGWREYLRLAAGRILVWLLQRREDTPAETEPCISVRFEDADDGPRVVFEDHSLRLPDRLRNRLLEPFASVALISPSRGDLAGPGHHLALYLAKVLVEEGCGGRLEDQTAEIESHLGHRFVIRLPASALAEAA
jgi:signal transduction histidine kinase